MALVAFVFLVIAVILLPIAIFAVEDENKATKDEEKRLVEADLIVSKLRGDLVRSRDFGTNSTGMR